MKKLLIIFLALLMGLPMFGQNRDQRLRKTSSNVNSRERAMINNGLDQTYVNEDSITAQAIDFTTGELTVTGQITGSPIIELYPDEVDMDDYTRSAVNRKIWKYRAGTSNIINTAGPNFLMQTIDTFNIGGVAGSVSYLHSDEVFFKSDLDLTGYTFGTGKSYKFYDSFKQNKVYGSTESIIIAPGAGDTVSISNIDGTTYTIATNDYLGGLRMDIGSMNVLLATARLDNHTVIDSLVVFKIFLDDAGIPADSLGKVYGIYNVDDGLRGVDGTYFLYSEYGDNYLNGDLEVTGNISADTLSCNVFDNFIPHMFLYFGDSTVSKSYTTDWAHLTNASDSIFIQDELEGFTVSNDTIVSTYNGDFNFDANFTHDADNGETVSIRFFNATTGFGIPVAGAQKGGGSGDYGSTSIIAYSEIAAGDKIVVQYKGDASGTAVFKNGVIRIKRIH